MTPLFVYGTLRHPELVERLLGRRPAMRPAVLPGWRAARLRDLPYPGLVAAAEGEAPGALFEVSDPELGVLDRFEGPMYERITVTVSAGGAVPGVHVWRLRDGHHELVLDQDWDLERFLRTDAGWFIGEDRS